MNPFKKDGYMLPIASINSIFIDDILAVDLFSPKLLIEEIDNNRENLNIENNVLKHELLFEFNILLAKGNSLAKDIASKHAFNLAKVLITLKKPSELSLKNHKNWDNRHWNYWSNISTIYLVGGLTSNELITIFNEVIKQEILKANIKDFTVNIVNNSANYGTLGLLSISEDNNVLLFDFGQSFIKRGYAEVVNSTKVFNDSLVPIKSKFIDHKGFSNCDLKVSAKRLHDHILKCIIDTVNEVSFEGNVIKISIANYIYKGKIYESRGGYAKLHLLADNYEEFLKKSIEKLLNKKIDIKLYHDTSSMAFMFSKNTNEAVISLGTGFGVSFLD